MSKKMDMVATPEKEALPFADVPDFEFAQKDDRIFDKKFDTKPTTFFKDALKRFVKNKSSVVASAILLILIGVSIVVPFADKNDITTNIDTLAYLPPKWFNVNGAHFMDGTGYVEKAILDPSTKKLPSDSTYKQIGVLGEMNVNESYANSYSALVANYGQGGDVAISYVKDNNDLENPYKDSGIVSQSMDIDMSDDISFTFTFDYEAMNANNGGVNPTVFLGLESEFETGITTFVSFGDDLTISSDKNVFAYNDVASLIKNNADYIAASSPSSVKASLVIGIRGDEEHVEKNVYLTSVSGNKKSDFTDISLATFSDATTFMGYFNKKTVDAETGKALYYDYWASTTSVDIYHAKVYYGSFQYDYYEAAFGEDTYMFAEETINDYIKKGYMTYEWTSKMGVGTEPGKFTLTELGEKYCPIREVISQTHTKTSAVIGKPVEVKELYCKRSLYRYDYSMGYIGSCAPQKYFFGTNKFGHDFFKEVFSGLLTSLGLGFLSAVINIVIGVIWGSISGYFGGWVDMLMERFCEILGGMPWIVMMTLIILLLGSNFWTFLLALCLTGWMGVASSTRSQFYRYKGREYVLASRTLGASDRRLIFRHILPNGIGTIVTGSVLMIPSVIFTEANISYLLPNALAFSGSQSFGITLSNAQADIGNYSYLIVSASIIMALIMISFNLFGNGLRDAFNPSLKGAED